ncbi:MAG: ribosomal protein L7/L12 [Pseudomonadales bacterium]
MNTETELPADVIAEIQANRKVSAIKLLRAHEDIGLKEAKEVVDAYISKHPSTSHSRAQESEGSFGRILVLILGVGLIYSIYSYFT